MSSINFTCLAGNDESQEVAIETWPKPSFGFVKKAKVLSIGLKAQSGTTPVVLRIESKSAREIQVINIPKWFYVVLKRIRSDFQEIYVRTAEIWRSTGVVFGKTNKPLSVLCLKTVSHKPMFAIVSDNSTNFYCSYAIMKCLSELENCRDSNPRLNFKQLVSLAQREFSYLETFEQQYNDHEPLRNCSQTTQLRLEEFTIETDEEVFESNQRRSEYKDFIRVEGEKDYPEANDGTLKYVTGLFMKNKLFIQDYNLIYYHVNDALDLSDRKLLTDEMVSNLKDMKLHLEQQAVDKKCLLCTTNWINCMLPTCMHMSMCRECTVKNRNQFHRYSCPICKAISSFIITDVDFPYDCPH